MAAVDTELVSATGIDTLEFEPIQNTAVGKLIEGFDVKVVDSDGNVDTNNNEAMTVGLVSSDEGTLGWHHDRQCRSSGRIVQ